MPDKNFQYVLFRCRMCGEVFGDSLAYMLKLEEIQCPYCSANLDIRKDEDSNHE